jgi:hypothetical protein
MRRFVGDLVEDLKTKHLWPVALGLLIALIAVPLLLAKPAKKPSAAAPPATPSTTSSSDGPGGFQSIADVKPIVIDQPQFASQKKSDRKFVRKNPFAGLPAGSTAGASGGDASAGTGTGSGTDTGTTPDSSGTTYPYTPTGGTGTGGTKYYHYVVTAKFGEEGKKQKDKKLTALRSLPDSDNAVIVFLGVRSDGKTAVFLMSSSATTTGDGSCVPSDDECSFLYMKKNDTQTIEAVSSSGEVTTYELKLVNIKLEADSSPSNSGGAGDGGSGTGDTGTGDPTASAKRTVSTRPPSSPHSASRSGRVSRRVLARKHARQLRKQRHEQRARQRQAARAVGTIGF